MMSKAKMAAAQAYIDAKEYDNAREILYTINDPAANQRLAQLQQIDPNGGNHPHLLTAIRMSAPPAPSKLERIKGLLGR